MARALDCGGLFKDYDLHKVKSVSTEIEEMDAVTLKYWLSKFVMEVANISRELKYPPKPVYGIICAIKRHLCKAAGVKRKTAHSLRVTSASSLFSAGVEERLIRERTGHRSNALFKYEKPTEENAAKVSAVVYAYIYKCVTEDIFIFITQILLMIFKDDLSDVTNLL